MSDRDGCGRFLPGNQTSSQGGRAQKAKHRDHLASWGRMGYQATVERHFNGDELEANRWLVQAGLYAQDQLLAMDNWLYIAPDPGPHPARKNRT